MSVRIVTPDFLLQMAKLSVADASDSATARPQPLPQPTPQPSSPTPPLPPPPPALPTVAAPLTAANPPARQIQDASCRAPAEGSEAAEQTGQPPVHLRG
eukprot:gene33542-40578_t